MSSTQGINYRYLLFDLDNTILDFTLAAKHALKKAFFEFGVPDLPEYIDQYHEVNNACWKAYENGKLSQEVLRYERFRRFMEQVKLEADTELMSELYLKWLSEGVYWVEGAQALIEACKDQFQLVIVTNGIADVQRPRLRDSGLDQICSPLIISGELGVAKPHHDFFEHTFDQMGHPSKDQVLMIGDNIHSDIRGGHDYGIDTCWFNPKKKAREATDVQPTYEIQHLDQLKRLLFEGLIPS